MLVTPGLLRPDTLAGPITVLARGWEEEEAVDILLSPSLGAVEEWGGEVTDDLAPSVEGEEAGL